MLNHNKIALFFVAILMLLAILLFFNKIEFWIFGIVGLLWFLTSLIGSSLIGSNYHVKAYCSNSSETQNKIAITFDDGPHEMTLLILEILRKHNAKATFFCIGKNIEKHPDILKKIVDEGHLIGNHSYSHSHFFDFYRKQQVLQELNDTNALIEKIIGEKVRFFRPPYGVTNPSIRRALAVTKHKVIGWNIRSLDAVIRNEKKILDRITKRIQPGGIILLHDTSIHTVNVLEQLLEVLHTKKYDVIALEQLLNLKAYED